LISRSHSIVTSLVAGFLFAGGSLLAHDALQITDGQRIAFVGNSTAERMNLFGHLETRMQFRFHMQRPVIRNFGWPADEVGNQQRPGNYTLIDDPLQVFGPDLFICFFGFNESYAGTSADAIKKFIEDYRSYIEGRTEDFTLDGRKPRFVLVTPIAFESTGSPLQPSGAAENERLAAYADAVRRLGKSDGHRVIDLWQATAREFSKEPGPQFTINGIHLNEDDEWLTLGVANGKTQKVEKEEIEILKPMKASSMPEGLLETIAPSEFLDLIAFLSGDWIATFANKKLPLRKHGDFVEVSRQSQVKLGKDFPSDHSAETNLLLSGKQPRKHDFAFHSANSKTNATDVIIRLQQPSEICHVELENRRSKQFHNRTDGLAMWVSDDGQKWTQVWASKKPVARWSFDLPDGTKGKFVKLALTKPGIFHLNQAVFYGYPRDP
jgi:hypothetical protein